ncbi:phage tail protein [Pseudomonas chlororaphis]|uniref:phage tail-collar fiber domain-containing protein n=1 Tax=Pseudomonas chlororaphis TaxID=587753 RepID=UPI000F58E240|nr:phage tail protein [Pseudomonas chlororaphis]AZC59958.1 Phage tail fiber protein [Pseudomonas chlororaphis subsp. piscium]
MARITLAGESLIAQKQGTQQVLNVARFIFANVPGLDPQSPIDRAAPKPPANQIVHTYTIPSGNSGYVNPNQVVYSSMLGSDIGDFDWNWLGLETAEGVLFAVAYVPLQQKRRNIPPLQLGNNVTRNILVEFTGAQELTGITIDASTWQHDFTARLKGIDERERLSNRDVYGRACFFDSGLQLEKVGQVYRLKPGQAYVEGVRVLLPAAVNITPTSLPTTAWLDVALQRQSNDVVASWQVVFAANKADYVDSAGVQHYCVVLGDLTAAAITDRRVVEAIKGPLLQHLAARVGTYPQLRAQATTKDDVDLGNIPNAISDDASTNSSEILATTKAVHGVQVNVTELVDGTTPAGKAKQLATARKIAISGAGTGNVSFDGSQDVTLNLTLADSGATAGTYTKVTINAKGLVTAGGSLVAADIPNLDWSKIATGRPTTLVGYGITDAIPTGYTNKRPQLYAPAPGRDYFAGAMEIREAMLVTDTQNSIDYAPRIVFHWGKVTAADLAMDTTGALQWNGLPVWTAHNFSPASKADKATTLGGYGITDAVKKADYGLASSYAPLSAIDTIGLPGGFHYFGGGYTSFVDYVSLINIPYGSNQYASQIGLQQGGPEPRMFCRSVKNGSTGAPDGWTPTREVYHTGNLKPETIVPAGTLVQSFCRNVPTGTLRCNGAAVSRTTFAALFAAIGTLYGAGDGATTFNLPDTRGLFTRDVDDGRGFDPGRAQGTVQDSQNRWHGHTASAGEAGWHSHPGSYVAEAGAHVHTAPRAQNNNVGGGSPNFTTANYENGATAATHAAGAHTHGLGIVGDGVHTHAITIAGDGGNEARPVNMALYYFIKY